MLARNYSPYALQGMRTDSARLVGQPEVGRNGVPRSWHATSSPKQLKLALVLGAPPINPFFYPKSPLNPSLRSAPPQGIVFNAFIYALEAESE